MLNINTNYASAFAANATKSASKGLHSAMEKLSTGLRINYAKNDASGMAISTRLTAEIEGLKVASRNAADAQSLIDTAEGALQESTSILLRMRELAIQASTSTLTDSDRAHAQNEFSAMRDEYDRISSNTSWAGKQLLNGNSFTFQIGTNGTTDDQLTVSTNIMNRHNPYIIESGDDYYGINETNISGNSSPVQISTQESAGIAIKTLDNALNYISTERGKLGAVSNRLSSTISNLDQIVVNLSASQGRIQDADFALETSNLAKSQILQQAATAMLSQANASKASVLSLIRS